MTSKPDKSSGSRSGTRSLAGWIARIRDFLEKDLWEFGVGNERSLRGQGLALLRILTISWKGLSDNRLFSRAAALSYSTLVALGPLVAVIVAISGSFLKSDPEMQIKRVLLFIAPSLQEMVTMHDETQLGAASAEMQTAIDSLIEQITHGAEQLISSINTGGSRAFGAIGGLILIWIIIQLLTSIETALNQIWGVHQGRPWAQRIVFYWTFVSLGALLGLGSTALFSASNLASMFDWVPFSSEMTQLLISYSQLLSFFMMVLLLVLFYRFFPNTSVSLKPALFGSLLTATLLIINNYLSILYVHRVISLQSFYGSMGILPVMMIGLYFFWILILLGGQLTYAAQNVSFLANQAAWQKISSKVRELATLSAFLHIARRFQACEVAPTVIELSNRLHIPVNILNESLDMLESIDWIIRVSVETDLSEKERTGYRPARPLEHYNLSFFKQALDECGQSDMAAHLARQDSLISSYVDHIGTHLQEPFFQTNLKELLGN